MTPQEREARCRTLAEWLEPFATLPPPTVGVFDEAKPSPRGAWMAEMRYEDNDVPKWYARNFYASEAASAMLLEHMPEPELWLEDRAARLWGCAPDIFGSQDLTVQFSDRKTAVAEAALAFIAAQAMGAKGE